MQNHEAVVGNNSSKFLLFLWLIIWHLTMTHLPKFYSPNNDELLKIILLHILFQVVFVQSCPPSQTFRFTWIMQLLKHKIVVGS